MLNNILIIIGLLFSGLVTKVIDQKDTCKIKECEMNDKKVFTYDENHGILQI